MILAVLCLAAPAFADSISLSVTSEPIEEVTGQVTYQVSAEPGSFPAVYVNPPSVPCAPNPEADAGTPIVTPETSGFDLEGGAYKAWADYTPSSTGAYTVCGWLIRFEPWAEHGWGTITASSSLPLDVRSPHVSLALSAPRSPRPGTPFVLSLDVSSEVPVEFVVELLPSGEHDCPPNWAESKTWHLIDTELMGTAV